MKTLIAAALLLVIAVVHCGCRYNGNTTVNVTPPAISEKGLAPLPGSQQAASGAVNVIIYGNTATQDAGKVLDGMKAAASASNAQGASTASSGSATLTDTPVSTGN